MLALVTGEAHAQEKGGGGTFGGAVAPPQQKRRRPAPRPPRKTCSNLEFYYGGKCMKRSKIAGWAVRSWRLFVQKQKPCAPGFPYRAGSYCYVCPSGRYWTKGGACVTSCRRGQSKDFSQRRCKASGGVVGGRVPGQAGRRCAANRYYYGGRCQLRSKIRKWARNSSRLFTMTNKPCAPGFPYRKAKYCYVCPPGKYWLKGGICVRRCSKGINFAERKCKSSGITRVRPSRAKSCPPGQYYYASRCQPNAKFRRWARTSSRVYTARGKACPPGFPYRSSTHCYVCPPGKYWKKGAVCTKFCSRGKDFTNRKCKGSGSSSSYKPKYKYGKRCPAGSIREGNKCYRCRAGCYYIGSGKCRCPRR
jgi:hypothetical protein